ncbi:(2R,3R)-2,3-butanediol dehydrogenase [Gryganskiella cystojenkinii]|nr:(2R,3R)-2,3-butanediol dehydrogenase [Gryganskiella cystojenkinii]
MTYSLTNKDYLVVVVTGCDTGFGAEIVQDLHQHGGYTIYATCLTAKAVEANNAKNSTRLRSLQVDVTKQDDVNRLRAQVEAECPQGVFCVFNNAGIFAGGFFDFATEDNFQRVMDVNYMGIIRITKGLLPSLRAYARSRHTLPEGRKLPRARLLSITSVAGRSNPPGHGCYTASKHAAESILDTLRVELSPWEIDVSILEPYYAKTLIVAGFNSLLETAWKQASSETRSMYGPRFIDGVKAQSKHTYKTAMPSKWVVDAAVKAIRQKRSPKARMIVGFWWVGTFLRLQEQAPEWIIDGIARFALKRLGSWPSDPFLLKAA